MNFSRVSTSDPIYKARFGDVDIQNFKVYTAPDHCMGKVIEVLRDESQNDYLAVETGTWLSKRELIVPVSQFNLVPTQSRIYLENLVLDQDGDRKSYRLVPQPVNQHHSVNGLPEREIGTAQMPVELSAPLEASAPLDAAVLRESQHHVSYSEERPVANAKQIQPLPASVGTVPAGQEPIRLLEERLVVNRHRRKVGEVVVRKEIETQMIEVPIHREKLVIEQLGPERKQLASIQLGQRVGDHQTGFDLSDLNDSSERAVGVSQITQPGISLATAKRLIDRLNQSSEFNQTRVQLVFEDQELQNQYHQWLIEQNSTNSTVR